jgi:hypothetical protein
MGCKKCYRGDSVFTHTALKVIHSHDGFGLLIQLPLPA